MSLSAPFRRISDKFLLIRNRKHNSEFEFTCFIYKICFHPVAEKLKAHVKEDKKRFLMASTVRQPGLTITLSPARWTNRLGWSEMPPRADASLSWFSCHSSKWAAKSIVTRSCHFTVSLEGLVENKKKTQRKAEAHQNKVGWGVKFLDTDVFLPRLKRNSPYKGADARSVWSEVCV